MTQRRDGTQLENQFILPNQYREGIKGITDEEGPAASESPAMFENNHDTDVN